MLSKSEIKINYRGLIEIVLACALLALAIWGVWYFALRTLGNADAAGVARNAEAPLLPYVLQHPAMMISATFAGFLLLLALALTLVPISWWLRTDTRLDNVAAPPEMTPMGWLVEKMGLARKPQLTPQEIQDDVAGIYIVNEAGERIFVPQLNNGADGEVEANQEVVMVEQPDGTLLAMVQQADGTMVAAKTKEAKKENEGKEEEVDPLLPPPDTTLEGFSLDEEEESMLDLADIGDIINSAFDDDGPIDPQRQALSDSLEDVDILDLLADARNVLATFKQ